MPELPEVETVRRTLAPHLLGKCVLAVDNRRPDYVRGSVESLIGQRFTGLERHGKQLGLMTNGPALAVHLGMTGAMTVAAKGSTHEPATIRPHDHLILTLEHTRVALHDPRRFGHVEVYPTADALRTRHFATLGPDAQRITSAELRPRLKATTRMLKNALLDQQLIAGLGNIYVDEALFAAGLSPIRRACTIKRVEVDRLTEQVHRVLESALESGGSTLRDYVNARGESGGFQHHHAVYGRAGQPCGRCGQTLLEGVLGGRATVCCPQCQSVSPRTFARYRRPGPLRARSER